jgi:hypothetical protein
MIIVKATKDSEARKMPSEKLIAQMATYHEELQKAGALLDASGLQPSSQAWRIRYSGEKRTVIDGPFAETKELIAGYTIIKVNSRKEALEWTKRFPNPAGDGKEAEIEVRQLFELNDFGPSEAVDRFRQMEIEAKKQFNASADHLSYRKQMTTPFAKETPCKSSPTSSSRAAARRRSSSTAKPSAPM